MTDERDPEGELHARVERALTAMPGPDPARLAAIRQSLRAASVRPWRHRGWLPPVVLAGALAGATAAGWYAAQPGESTGSADDSAPAGADRADDERGGDAAGTEHRERAPAGGDEDDTPIIYRR